MKQKIKKDDTVRIITGSHKNKEGKCIDIDYKNQRIKVENIALLTHYVKKSDKNNGGLIKSPGFIHLSNVKLVETKNSKKNKG